MTVHTLYGTPLSLYTGKARSYLIKNGLPYREIIPATKYYEEKVRPAAKMLMMPTVETADGVVIRDGAAIVEHFESASGASVSPDDALPAHSEQLDRRDRDGGTASAGDALSLEFRCGERGLPAASFCRDGAAGCGWECRRGEKYGTHARGGGRVGVAPDAVAGVERRYARFLTALDRHFAAMPYLLGHRPCIGDMSLIAPMYGHLGRDPKPLALMQAKAINVFRWVERMNRPELDQGEFITEEGDAPPLDFLPDDEIAETLIDVLRAISVDFVPETLAAASFINDWLVGENKPAEGTPIPRGVGMASFETEGESINALAQPYRFYLLARVQADYDALGDLERGRVDAVLNTTGLAPVLGARLTREIGRDDNLEVWL